MTAKPQRIRDPLHDLIEFSESKFDQGLWHVLNSEEFQRLRRIKQLGFTELVYPGGTHSRFAHSVGVFCTAKSLSGVIARLLGEQFDKDRSQIALCAALVHDIGHGPFSHAFESAMKELQKRRNEKGEVRHEIWTGRIIREDTELGRRIEDRLGADTREAVATLLLQETPTDIYSGLVSSQFDADRLDYLRRDRLMTGVSHGSFDYSWLVANLEVDTVPFATDDENFANVQSLILGHKAFQAAEAYVLGLFHMYFAVYFHKATRSAEKMLTALLVQLGGLLLNGKIGDSGLSKGHPIAAFLRQKGLGDYLSLDDSAIWGALPLLMSAKDPDLANLARRLRNRDLYKAFDVTDFFKDKGRESSVAKFRAALNEAKKAGEFGDFDLFEDSPERDPYKRRGYDTPDALSKVLIRETPNGRYDDIANISDVVSNLKKRKAYRVYAASEEVSRKILKIAEEVK